MIVRPSHFSTLSLAFAAALAGALLAAPAQAQAPAVSGMDTVELYTTGRLVPGRGDLATAWHGQAWLFVSEPNRSAFESDPRRFAPGFDGLCPPQLAEGHRTPGRPDLAVMIDGRMYLTSSPEMRARLLADPAGVLAAAKAQR